MENGHDVNALTMNCSLATPLDASEHARSPQDVLNRRLKNRERQRRYRLRKRLEADKKKATNLNQSTPPQVQPQLPGPPIPCVTRVHCRRDWKKDARTAHVYREDCKKSNDPIMSNTTLVTGGQMPVESEMQSRNSPVPDNGETPRNTLSRRHWKAEARNKNN